MSARHPVAGRQPAELHREQQLGEDAEPEHRRGVGDHAEEAAADVERPVALAGRPGPHQDADDDREDHREHRQLEGGREPVGDDLVTERGSVYGSPKSPRTTPLR